MKTDIINGEVCKVCGKISYISEKHANEGKGCILRHKETAKTKIPKRAYLSKECSINGYYVWHLTNSLKK